MPKVICPELSEAARALVASGVSIRQAAARLGISRQTLRRAIAALAIATTPAMAESPCQPSSVVPAWAMEQGDAVLLSTTDGGMTGLVSAWLSAHHAPALVADDYVLVSGAERTLVIPVRAGMVCRGEAMVQLPADAAAAMVRAMVERTWGQA